MNLLCETNRLLLKILQPVSSPMVLDFYLRNKDFLEPFEPDRVSLFYTNAFHNAQLSYEYNHMCTGGLLRYWIFEKSQPDKAIGSVCLHQITRGSYFSAVLSYKMDQSYLRQGYATEAITRLLEWAFTEQGLHRIEAYIMPDNIPSIALIEKLGFLPEGISRSSVILKGKWMDQIRYALINPNHSI